MFITFSVENMMHYVNQRKTLLIKFATFISFFPESFLYRSLPICLVLYIKGWSNERTNPTNKIPDVEQMSPLRICMRSPMRYESAKRWCRFFVNKSRKRLPFTATCIMSINFVLLHFFVKYSFFALVVIDEKIIFRKLQIMWRNCNLRNAFLKVIMEDTFYGLY